MEKRGGKWEFEGGRKRKDVLLILIKKSYKVEGNNWQIKIRRNKNGRVINMG